MSKTDLSKTGLQKSAKLLWIAGIVVWFLAVLFLWWHGYDAQTFAQASRNSTRLELASGIGDAWSLVGAALLAKLKKTPTA